MGNSTFAGGVKPFHIVVVPFVDFSPHIFSMGLYFAAAPPKVMPSIDNLLNVRS